MNAVMHQLAPLMAHHEFGQLVVEHTESLRWHMLISPVGEYHLDKRFMYVPRSKARLVVWSRLPVMLSVMQTYGGAPSTVRIRTRMTTGARATDYLRDYSLTKTFSLARSGRERIRSMLKFLYISMSSTM